MVYFTGAVVGFFDKHLGKPLGLQHGGPQFVLVDFKGLFQLFASFFQRSALVRQLCFRLFQGGVLFLQLGDILC